MHPATYDQHDLPKSARVEERLARLFGIGRLDAKSQSLLGEPLLASGTLFVQRLAAIPPELVPPEDLTDEVVRLLLSTIAGEIAGQLAVGGLGQIGKAASPVLTPVADLLGGEASDQAVEAAGRWRDRRDRPTSMQIGDEVIIPGWRDLQRHGTGAMISARLPKRMIYLCTGESRLGFFAVDDRFFYTLREQIIMLAHTQVTHFHLGQGSIPRLEVGFVDGSMLVLGVPWAMRVRMRRVKAIVGR